MMDFLVRRFVKDFENVENAKVRTAYGMLASITGICCNLLLFGGKLFAGLVVNSISVMADAFNNLSDAASSLDLLGCAWRKSRLMRSIHLDMGAWNTLQLL